MEVFSKGVKNKIENVMQIKNTTGIQWKFVYSKSVSKM